MESNLLFVFVIIKVLNNSDNFLVFVENCGWWWQKRVEEKVVMVRSLIGSRPPRCERRCMSCGHCEAVQVPIVPSLKHQKIRSNQFFATPTIAYSRGDDISNYKPMCWKCKCGNFIFNSWLYFSIIRPKKKKKI